MPEDARALSPLPPSDIQRFLQGIFTDPAAPVDLAIEAFAVTAASLYGWCKPGDIELAMSLLAPQMPVPRCLHGESWNVCKTCPLIQAVA
jgi:hypothetical protein